MRLRQHAAHHPDVQVDLEQRVANLAKDLINGLLVRSTSESFQKTL
jgi:hypothetical protein